MSTLASLLVAAAVAWCADNPADRACGARNVTPAVLSEAQTEQLEDLAHKMRFRHSSTRSEGPERDVVGNSVDIWRPNRFGDCEDRVLWALAELRRSGMHEAAEILLLMPARDTRRGHIVLAVHTDQGPFILDPARREGLLRLSDYDNVRVYLAPEGVGKRWALRPSS